MREVWEAIPGSGSDPDPLGLAESARLPAADVLERLGSSQAGLSATEASERLRRLGANAIRTHDVRPLAILARQIRNPLLILLAAATLVSLGVGERTNAVIIFGIVGLSVGLGFLNEFRSERVVAALHASIRHRAEVTRDGASQAVDVTELVPGDVVHLKTGDLVPADLRLISVHELECDEAVLTGEPMPKTKSADPQPEAQEQELGLRGAAYMGTTVRGGSGFGVVVGTGALTAFGRIALRLGERQPETAFQRGLRSFSMLLVWVTAVLAGAIFVLNSLLGRPVIESALFALAISVGLTPQLLPAIVTVSLASGARSLARRRVIVKRLISIEDLGNIEVLFTDKTGTLTEGRISYRASLAPDGSASDQVLRLALLCSAATSNDPGASGNALDSALLEAGSPPAGFEVLDRVEFDHERRLMSVLVAQPDGQHLLITKGAPEAILERCVEVPNGASETLLARFQSGARVIAVATRAWRGPDRCTTADEHDLELRGFIDFLDLPKADAAQALRQLRRLGVEVKVVTGDNPIVAQNVCSAIGLRYGETLTGPEIDRLSDSELSRRLKRTGIFARVSPDQKARLINLQRSLDRDVGCLGDGVNDAVALRNADVGISVDSGSEVAKDAADIVLLDKDLGILAGGVREGRRIFANTMKYVLMGTSSNFGNMFSAAGGSLILNFLPMTPTQILLNNLLYDTGEMTIPTDRVDLETVRRPAQWDIRMIRRFMFIFGPISSIFDFATFGVMLLGFHARGSFFQTAWFVESLATQSLVVFAIRTRRVPFFRSRPGTVLVLGTLAAVAVGVLLPYSPLARLFGFTPLPWAFLALLVLMIAIYLTLVELGKSIFLVGRPPTLPVSRWERAPTVQMIEKFASRWSVEGGRRRARRARSLPAGRTR